MPCRRPCSSLCQCRPGVANLRCLTSATRDEPQTVKASCLSHQHRARLAEVHCYVCAGKPFLLPGASAVLRGNSRKPVNVCRSTASCCSLMTIGSHRRYLTSLACAADFLTSSSEFHRACAQVSGFADGRCGVAFTLLQGQVSLCAILLTALKKLMGSPGAGPVVMLKLQTIPAHVFHESCSVP